MTGKGNGWLSQRPSKRWAEVFFLAYSAFWILWILCVFVPFQLYEKCDEVGYLAVGLCVGLPPAILPILLRPKCERHRKWHQCYWVKANVWVAIFSFIGNYFWTHYFYELLGASYTFPAHRLNQVPLTLYFMTHAYFLFYHTLASLCIRRAQQIVPERSRKRMIAALVVFILAYATAYMETVTIAHFPHYRFKEKSKMYTTGSLFYAIYFFVSFPVYFNMDEDTRSTWSLGRAATDALASGMLVTIVLDLWRLSLGGIVPSTGDQKSGLIWTLLVS